MSTTGDRIKAARQNANMTQQELAEKVGVKFSAIHKYETGMIVNLKRDTIQKLAEVLNVKPSYLLCMDEEIAKSTGMTDGLSKKQIDLIERVKACDDDTITKLNQILDIVLQGK